MRQVLKVRDAFADFAHVRSDELFAGTGREPPFLTIAIPTFRRPELLAEAVASALDQDFGRPFEVVVVDDDPLSTGHERLLTDLPRIAEANLRYLRNRENFGDCANHNRCVESARGIWLTILHDDDLLDRGFARTMFAQLEADPRIDGLVCRKRWLDCRESPYRESRFRRAARKLMEVGTFGTKSSRRIDAAKLFWANLLGNPVGFVFRKRDSGALGGFYPEDYPSADYFFYARFAERLRLHQSKEILATTRAMVNASMRKDVNVAALRKGYLLQTLYAGTVLPQYWRKVIPLLMARQIAVTSYGWRNRISAREVSDEIGIPIPRDRPLLLHAIRVFLRGF